MDSSTGLLSSMHNPVDFLLLEAYGLFFHYSYGKTNHKLSISSMLEINKYQDEKPLLHLLHLLLHPPPPSPSLNSLPLPSLASRHPSQFLPPFLGASLPSPSYQLFLSTSQVVDASWTRLEQLITHHQQTFDPSGVGVGS